MPWSPAESRVPETKEAQHRSCLLSNPSEGLLPGRAPPFLLTDKTFQGKKNSFDFGTVAPRNLKSEE